jgi:uncharacterized membrane protein
MELTENVISAVGVGIETAGVLIILLGLVGASLVYACNFRQGGSAYANYRRQLGRSIILGLEFLVAGDIVRTVIVESSLENVGVLALIVLVRTFLSFTLHMEVEGRWPWQRGASENRSV